MYLCAPFHRPVYIPLSLHHPSLPPLLAYWRCYQWQKSWREKEKPKRTHKWNLNWVSKSFFFVWKTCFFKKLTQTLCFTNSVLDRCLTALEVQSAPECALCTCVASGGSSQKSHQLHKCYCWSQINDSTENYCRLQHYVWQCRLLTHAFWKSIYKAWIWIIMIGILNYE